MDTLLFISLIISIYWGVMVVSYVLAWLFTEVLEPPINRKPFNCRGCLSFWLTTTYGILAAFLITPGTAGRLALSVLSVILGLLNYLYIRKKFKIYE